MPKNSHYAILAMIWLSIAILAWLVAVPQWISPVNLVWLSGFALVFCAILLAVQRAGQPSRSVAAILYDTEHTPRSRQ
jgi:hypothetical protein